MGHEKFFRDFLEGTVEEQEENTTTIGGESASVEDEYPRLRRGWLFIGGFFTTIMVILVVGLGYFYSRADAFLTSGFLVFAEQNGGVEQASALVGAGDWLPAALWVHDNVGVILAGILVLFGGLSVICFWLHHRCVKAYNLKIDELIEKELTRGED